MQLTRYLYLVLSIKHFTSLSIICHTVRLQLSLV
jgi:hypothetical protein